MPSGLHGSRQPHLPQGLGHHDHRAASVRGFGHRLPAVDGGREEDRRHGLLPLQGPAHHRGLGLRGPEASLGAGLLHFNIQAEINSIQLAIIC